MGKPYFHEKIRFSLIIYELVANSPSTANCGPPPSRREVVLSSLQEGAGGVRRLRENS